MATYARDALSAVRRRRDVCEMRSQAPGDGKFSPWCVPGRPFAAIFSLHASPKGPRTGKAPLPGSISPPCIQNELALAIFARHVSEKPCKSPFGNAWHADLAREGPFSLHRPLKPCIVRRSCHPLAIFAFRWRGALPRRMGNSASTASVVRGRASSSGEQSPRAIWDTESSSFLVCGILV